MTRFPWKKLGYELTGIATLATAAVLVAVLLFAAVSTLV